MYIAISKEELIISLNAPENKDRAYLTFHVEITSLSEDAKNFQNDTPELD